MILAVRPPSPQDLDGFMSQNNIDTSQSLISLNAKTGGFGEKIGSGDDTGRMALARSSATFAKKVFIS